MVNTLKGQIGAKIVENIEARYDVVKSGPALTVQPDNTITLDVDWDDFSVTVTEPPHFAGTYQIPLECMFDDEIELVPAQNGHPPLKLVRQS